MLLDILKSLQCNYKTARKNSTTNLLMDDGALELALQHDRRLQLLNLYTSTKLPNEGHPSVHWLLEGIYSIVHDKIIAFSRYKCAKYFIRACSYAIVCMLHESLAALTHGTILNHTHVSHVANAQGIYLTHELYCILHMHCIVDH